VIYSYAPGRGGVHATACGRTIAAKCDGYAAYKQLADRQGDGGGRVTLGVLLLALAEVR
jgi:hypothetical protein